MGLFLRRPLKIFGSKKTLVKKRSSDSEKLVFFTRFQLPMCVESHPYIFSNNSHLNRRVQASSWPSS